MPAGRKNGGWVNALFGPETLIPVAVGLTLAILAWALLKNGAKLGLFLAILSGLAWLGTAFTRKVLNTKSVDPALAKLRRELLGGLDGAWQAEPDPAAEHDRTATAAHFERS